LVNAAISPQSAGVLTPAGYQTPEPCSGQAAADTVGVQLAGGKLRGGTDESARRLSARAARELGSATDPAKVTLPPYYPRDPVLLRDGGAYLDSVRFTDEHVGKVIGRLEQEGILDQTLVIFLTDNGISHARGRQFLYHEGG
jgi:hypothetical protein